MKKRKLENKITKIVDGNGRESAENLISKQLRNVIQDFVDVIVQATKRNPDNPYAEMGIDAESVKYTLETLLKLYKQFDAKSEGQKAAKRKAIRRIKKSANRVDVCYLANLNCLANDVDTKLTTLLNSVKDGLRAPWAPGSAEPSTKHRKYVPKVRDKQVREFAKTLNGKPLREKCLNVVEERLMNMPDKDGTMKKFLGENAVRVSNALHDTLKEAVDTALDAIHSTPDISADDLHRLVYQTVSPKFGAARSAAKVASRGLVSGTLNMAIVDETERLVNMGLIKPEHFLLNRPGFLYKAVMDMRTSDICRTLNGLIIPLSDKMRIARYMPPQHANCRSILIPNLRP